jgi:RNase P/RNase MRP subunit p30
MKNKEYFEILREKNFNKLKEQVKKVRLSGKNVVFYTEDDEYNRKVSEKLDVDFLIIPLSERRDYMKQRNSGFNEVLAKIFKKRNISLGVDFKEILSSKDKEKILGRLRQNVVLCNKNKIQIRFFNIETRDEKSLKSLGLVLGMPTWMVKDLV